MFIDIRDNFDEVVKAFGHIEKKLVATSVRYSINRTLLTLRMESIKAITEKYRVKPKTLRQKLIWLKKAKGGTLGSTHGIISYSGEPIPMMQFVRGNKTPQSQKGVPIKRRRKLKVEIIPGKRFVLKRAFIQTVHSTQVFKRAKSGGLKKQGVASIAQLMRNRGILDDLTKRGQERFREVFIKDLDARIKGYIPTIPETYKKR